MIAVGMTVWGSCEGYFGRDFYAPSGARVEAIGWDWVVIRDEYGFPRFATFDSNEDLVASLTKWNKEEPNYEN